HIFCGASIPFLLCRFYWPVVAALFLAVIFYSASELARLSGHDIPLVSSITAVAARKRDENRFVFGPVTLAIGILLAALLWNSLPAQIGIYSLAFGDGLASLAGKLFGRMQLPMTQGKTAAGSLTCFLAIFIACFLVSGSCSLALLIAAVGMFIELLPLKDYDNVVIPLLLGGISQLLL
ncbi:MAG: phosphatidate cytidylyltransferase, partial [Treponema sp.]|nr:phosphatidate cytidylyltransferase [Treponema sp.]